MGPGPLAVLVILTGAVAGHTGHHEGIHGPGRPRAEMIQRGLAVAHPPGPVDLVPAVPAPVAVPEKHRPLQVGVRVVPLALTVPLDLILLPYMDEVGILHELHTRHPVHVHPLHEPRPAAHRDEPLSPLR